MNFTQEQLDTNQLPIRWKRIKLEVLNTDFQTLATLEGNAVGGSLQKDATNFVRRSGSIQMCIPNIASANTFLDYVEGVTINVNGKIWLDKYIKIWMGIDNYIQPYGEDPKTVWYNFGICLIDQPVRTFSADGFTMDFNVIDLSAKMNGDRSGQLAVITTLFPRVQGYDDDGKPIYTETEQAISTCIEELTEFKRYTIYPIPDKWKYLPYDIKMDVGSTVYTALEQFLNILSGWQMYFDNDGIFVVEPIPSGANDIVYPLNLQLNTQDVNSVDFNNVRNQVIVYGRSHNVDFFGELSYDNQYGTVITFESLDISKIQVGSTVFGFTYTAGASYSLNVGYGESIRLVYPDSDNNIQRKVVYIQDFESTASNNHQIYKDVVYVFRIKDATVTDTDTIPVIDFTKYINVEFLGHQQVQSCIVNANIESPYYVNKPYKSIAYYAFCATTYINVGGNYLVFYLDLSTRIVSLPSGAIITCILPLNNGQYTDCRFYVRNISSGNINNAPINNLSANQIGGDYTIWAFRYNGTSFDLIGRCPYANTLVESGGEFDNIYADVLAEERAQYDLFLHTNMQNTITLSCVPDYSIDVNYRIKYNQSSALPPDAVVDETFEDRYFITKQVSYPLGLDGSAQTINAIEIYDDYNYVGYAYDLPTLT